MPLQKVKRGDETCWRWGDEGAVYCGKDGKRKALRQGYAIDPKKFREEMADSSDTTAEEVAEAVAELAQGSYQDDLMRGVAKYLDKKSNQQG